VLAVVNLTTWFFECGVFWANLMHLILRISKFEILGVPPIQVLAKNEEIKVFDQRILS
jgi:hypothetical protein